MLDPAHAAVGIKWPRTSKTEERRRPAPLYPNATHGSTTYTHSHPPPLGHAHATTPRGQQQHRSCSQPASSWTSTRATRAATTARWERPAGASFPSWSLPARRRRSCPIPTSPRRGRHQQEGAEAVHHHQVARELDRAGARQVPRGPAAVSRRKPAREFLSSSASFLCVLCLKVWGFGLLG